MPLAFETINQGTIAFGFFNIETDLLLLDHLFFFAPEFCNKVLEIAKQDPDCDFQSSLDVYHIDEPSQIGDLMAAIHGINYQGFIGHVYKIFPFPRQPENFRQKTYGSKNREVVEPLLKEYATNIRVPIIIDSDKQQVTIEKKIFSKTMFQELIKYVRQGGYPKWSNEGPPDYVINMKDKLIALNKNRQGIFHDLVFD